ncbi:MAG: SDR family NAD(P)-dependent oxidoreductase [Beijerinckiaceae bacterium]|nr:SDR family NAD(P)-dependent oxidoreductase [Beijerinckiaceae bacterium]
MKPQHALPADGCAWVTGASSGIGRSVALELARRGWIVAATARREDELSSLALEAESLLGRIVAYPADVTNPEVLAAVAETIASVHGPIALAFFNAGIAPYIRAPNIDLAAVRQVMDVNVMGVFNGLAAVLPAMALRGRGQIAVTASVAGYGGLPKAAAYGASKAAVINACEALKFDCDALGIKLQLVNPGFVATPLTAKNDFPMPFLVTEEDAAKRTVDGFAEDRFEIHYPRRLSWLMKVVNLLPYPLYFWMVGRTTGTRK